MFIVSYCAGVAVFTTAFDSELLAKRAATRATLAGATNVRIVTK